MNPILRSILFPALFVRRRLRAFWTEFQLANFRSVVKGGTLILRARNFPGEFSISATSDLTKRILLKGEFEPEITSLLERSKDLTGTVVNVGANVGLYAVFFAKNYENIKRVVAIEPNPEALLMLQENIARNGLTSKIDIVQACIGDTVGRVDLSLVQGKSEYSSLGKIVHSSIGEERQTRISVDMVPLDSEKVGLSQDQISMLFIDTEGAELLVLRGAKSILLRCRPQIVFECEDSMLRKFGHSSEGLEDYLSSLDYKVRNAVKPNEKLVHPFTGVAVAVPLPR